MRFRFTIRDLLWLTALVALTVGWWLDKRKLESLVFQLQATDRQQERLIEELKAAIGNYKGASYDPYRR